MASFGGILVNRGCNVFVGRQSASTRLVLVEKLDKDRLHGVKKG